MTHETKIILVCGGRNYRDYTRLAKELDALAPTKIIHGGATGADYLAAQYVTARGIACEVYPADWTQYGRSAGPIRNQRMLDLGRPNLVLAFPGGRGTADMVRRAFGAGIPVITVEAHGSRANGDPDTRRYDRS